jgi:predicted DNA-binding transcriptional regulator AlpA
METRLLDTHQTAKYLGVSEISLKKDRMNHSGKYPPFIKINKSIRYDINDVDKWIDEHKR